MTPVAGRIAGTLVPGRGVIALALFFLPAAMFTARAQTPATPVVLSATPNPSVLGTPVTLTASVSTGAGAEIAFYDGGSVLGRAVTGPGGATLTTRALGAGLHQLRAYHGAGSATASASSNVVGQTVTTMPANAFVAVVNGNVPASGAIAAADFNGDGKLDIAMVTAYTLIVAMGNGDGTFQNPVQYYCNGELYALVIGDFNFDGKPDVAALVGTGGGPVVVFLNNGDGTFGAPGYYSVGTSDAIAEGDFNGDGITDLAATGADGYLHVLKGRGDGTFLPEDVYPLSGQSSMVAADFNGDDLADIAVPSYYVIVLPGGPSGMGQQVVSTETASVYGSLAASADFNGDGKADLLGTGFIYDAYEYGNTDIEMSLGNGDGSCQAPIQYTIPQYASVVGVSDLNGDGRIDIVIAQSAYPYVGFPVSIGLLAGNGDGTFQPPAYFGMAQESDGYAIGDFNGDGRADIAVATDSAGVVTLLGTQATLAVKSGTPQTAIPGVAFAAPLQVIVTDLAGKPLSGVFVSFAASTASSGATATLSGAGATTDASGLASVTATANTTAGAYTVTASVGNLSANFALTNTLGAIASLTSESGSNQATPVGAAFREPLQALVTDVAKNPLSGVPVSFSAPASGASAWLSSATAVTDSTGTATITATANGAIGAYAVTASVGALTTTFALTNLTEPSVVFTASPNPATLGAAVTLTATLVPAGGTGKITFYDGTTVVGTAPIASGRATLSTKSLAAGSWRLRAIYEGDSTYGIAESGVVSEAVNAAPANLLTQLGNIAFSDYIGPVAMGDFNGDGVPDIAVEDQNTFQTDIYLGNGDGTFRKSGSVPVWAFVGLAAADLNGDGKLDLVASDSSHEYVLLGNGDGTFQFPAAYTLASVSGQPLIADFNGDGIPDLCFVEYQQVDVYPGKGDGTFLAPVPTKFNGGSAIVGDFNGDGKADLAVSSGIGVVILLGNGDGTFRTGAQYPMVCSLAVDLNGAGKLDLAGVTQGPPADNLKVMLGNGDGTFRSAVSYPFGTYADGAAGMAVGDFDGDGRLDVAVSDGDGSVRIMLGMVGGGFQLAGTYPAGLGLGAVLAGDFNGDGKTDFIAETNHDFVGALDIFLGSLLTLTVSGTPQTTAPGTTFPAPLQVTVLNGAGPVAGVTVTFTAPSQGASAELSSSSVTTDSSGAASVTATAGTIRGSFTVTAQVADAIVEFLLSNGPPVRRLPVPQ
jgi:hypothetical protein